MGQTASSRARAGGDRRARGPSSQEISLKRAPGADADGAATVRNVIPWRTVEKELAARLAAKAAAAAAAANGADSASLIAAVPAVPASDERVIDRAAEPIDDVFDPNEGPKRTSRPSVEPAPDSGVRSSSAKLDGPLDDLDLGAAAPLGRPLTYSMYTIADLESRDVQLQHQSLSISIPAPPTPGWSDAAKSGLVLLAALRSWARSSPRPRVLDVCRVPLTAFATDLRAVLATMPWRKIAIGSAVAFGSVCLLLAALVTVAELTDDLEPAHGSSTLSSVNANGTSPKLATPPADNTGADLRVAAAAPVVPTLELDDVVPPAPKKAAPKPAKPKAKKPIGTERFIP